MTAITTFCRIIPIFCCLLFAGCAGFQLRTAVVSGPEGRAAAVALQKMSADHLSCRCFDAEITVNLSISGWGGDRAASFSGYLQTMSPSYMKFVGVNPFGQPQLIVAMDGERFRTVLVPEAKVYTGNVGAKTFMKYAPPGFNPEDVFAWLAGRLGLGDGDIRSIREGETAGTYWFELAGAKETSREHLLFDVRAGVILRYVVSGRYDKVLVEVTYADYKDVGDCRLPGRMVIESPTQNGRLGMVLSDMVQCEELPTAVFDLLPPPGFESIIVE